MSWTIQCECGEQLDVDAGDANTAVLCRCGREVHVPPATLQGPSSGGDELTEDVLADDEGDEITALELDDAPPFGAKQMYCRHCAAWVPGLRQTPRHLVHGVVTFLVFRPWLLVWILRSCFPLRLCPECGQRTYAGPSVAARLATLPNILGFAVATFLLLAVVGTLFGPQWEAMAHFEQGCELYQAGHLGEAIDEYNLALSFDPDYRDAYYSRAIAHNESGNGSKALADVTRAIELDPDYVDAYFLRGTIRQQQEDLDGAIEDLTYVTQLDPKNAEAYHNRGIAYWRRDQYQLAIDDFDNAIRLHPEFAESHYLRGLSYLETDQLAKARDDLQKACELAQWRDDGYERALQWAKMQLEGDGGTPELASPPRPLIPPTIRL